MRAESPEKAGFPATFAQQIFAMRTMPRAWEAACFARARDGDDTCFGGMRS
jgi:hypothetical protein